MSVIEKLEKKIRNNPNDVRFKDIEKLLYKFGFKLDSVKGSHHNFVHPEFAESITDIVTIPKHKNLVKKSYVLKALYKIDMVKEEI